MTLYVSVVIPTCNRPEDLRRCLNSLIKVEYPSWDVLVVDQSDDITSQKTVEEFRPRLPNLMCQRMAAKGLSRARNLAIQATSAPIIAFIDDDCTVEADWLVQVANAFERHPTAALVLGTVRAVSHNANASIIHSFEFKREQVWHGRLAFVHTGGMGASMYLRRSRTAHIGPFDVYLGTGSGWFKGAEDQDYFYRVLASKGSIVTTPGVIVHHHGARDISSGAASRLNRDAAFSNGGHHMKLLRSSDLTAIIIIISFCWRYLNYINLKQLVVRRRSSGLAWFIYYLLGLRASFRLSVDPVSGLYCPKDPA